MNSLKILSTAAAIALAASMALPGASFAQQRIPGIAGGGGGGHAGGGGAPPARIGGGGGGGAHIVVVVASVPVAAAQRPRWAVADSDMAAAATVITITAAEASSPARWPVP